MCVRPITKFHAAALLIQCMVVVVVVVEVLLFAIIVGACGVFTRSSFPQKNRFKTF